MPVIITFAETRDGKVRRSSLETLSEGVRLASDLGASVESVLVGSGVQELASELGAYGAARVRVFDDESLGAYSTEAYTRAMAQAVQAAGASVVLIPFTALGKDLAPRLAGRLDAGLVTDCAALGVQDGQLLARRPVYSGKAYATVCWEGEPRLATLRPNVFALGTPDPSRKSEVVPDRVDGSARAMVTATAATAAGKVELTEAQIVVSGGRGMKGPEHFVLIRDLADALGAAVGASRAVVDAGWIDHQHQVGQTGKTVSPSLYVACAISGAIQHLAGMSSSKVIVAINKDKEAPIFRVASYGIVGDVFEILPKLTEEAKAHLAGRG
jgi:electron transfer flavoprotein alpha subunit